MATLDKSAVFINGSRLFQNVTVEMNQDVVRVLSASGGLLHEYPVTEIVKDGMAFDVVDPGLDDAPVRLVAQTGCGCGGMHPFTPDTSYSGSNPHLNRK